MLFLSHYASLLKRKIAADGLEAAGLNLRLPGTIKKFKHYWQDDALLGLSQQPKSPYAALRNIYDDYIKPRESANKDHKAPLSMLLYGPPGTGKTTLAEQMAVNLMRPLIIVTVSDFLAAGAAEIEARAKGIFDVLRSQKDVVILFDEIDQFLLDRNSQFYQKQSDVFKFMTPGMLTKLQDLRDSEDCIFIIATNYYERIDSAIKRRGRIDEHFLLCIPDQERRRKLIERFVLERFEAELENEQTGQKYKDDAGTRGKKHDFFEDISRKFGKGEVKEFKKTKVKFEEALEDLNLRKKRGEEENILQKTVLYAWGDLKNLVDSKLNISEGMDIESLAVALAEATEAVDSTVSLGAYRSRFKTEDQPPYEEFFLLLYLCAESNKALTASDKEAIRTALTQIQDFEQNGLLFLSNEGYIKDEQVIQVVEEYGEYKAQAQAYREALEQQGLNENKQP